VARFTGLRCDRCRPYTLPSMHLATTSKSDNQSINVVRTLAAVIVVVGHIRALFFEDYSSVSHGALPALFYLATSLGHAAVMVFFVLSGYWVGGSVLRSVRADKFNWRLFLISRLSRLWLVLLPALALTGLVDHAGLHVLGDSAIYQSDPSYHVLPKDLHESLTWSTLTGNVVFLQRLVTSTFGTNGALWSLAYEFWFYVLFASLVLAAYRRGVSRIAYLLATIFGVFALGVEPVIYFTFWLAGAVLAANTHRIRTVELSGRRGSTYRWTAAMVLVATMCLDKIRPGFTSDGTVAVTTAIFLALLESNPIPRSMAVRKGMSSVASYAHASFSLYSIHLPLVALAAAAAAPRSNQRWSLTPTYTLLGVCVLAGVMMLAWLFAQFTERHTDTVRRRLIHLGEFRRIGRSI